MTSLTEESSEVGAEFAILLGQLRNRGLPEGTGYDERVPKAVQAYDFLRKAIVTLRLSPGEALNEKDICSHLGISRTPLREAIQQLTTQNLIQVSPGSGTFVTRISMQSVMEGQLLRSSAEPVLAALAARMASSAQREQIEYNLFRQRKVVTRPDMMTCSTAQDDLFQLDAEFHRLIAEAACLPGVADTLRNGCSHLDRVRRLAFPVVRHFAEMLTTHETIGEAIIRGDEARARAEMTVHVREIYDICRRLLATTPSFFEPESSFPMEEFEAI